jgi:hypothetical protein
MKFKLFSKIEFEISAPIVVIEAFCYQSNFYKKYDLIAERKIKDVNKIGARINSKILPKCKKIIDSAVNLPIYEKSLSINDFLDLSDETREGYIQELYAQVIAKLIKIEGIGFSKATKILHTLYREIIPMIDNPLKKKYKQKINPGWSEFTSAQIFIDYYEALKTEPNWRNLNLLSDTLKDNNVRGLSIIRIFDILWWSYLKAEALSRKEKIHWSSITCG